MHRYRRPLLSYCRRLSIPEARVEDVLQQALLKIWIALRGGSEVRDLKAWMYRVVHNTAINSVRDAVHDRERLADPTLRLGVGQADLERGLVMREALAEVAALPDLQREVIVRTAVGGDSHEQVASDLGITDGAVRGLLYRARATLRTATTALTPPPLITWLAGRADQGGPAPERLGELAAGGGAAGLGGLIVKGGVVAVTAGTLLTGAVAHIRGSANHRAPVKVAVTARAHSPGAEHSAPALALPASSRNVQAGHRLARSDRHAASPSRSVTYGRRFAGSAPGGSGVHSVSPSVAPTKVPGTAAPGGSTQTASSIQTTGSTENASAPQSPSPGQGEAAGAVPSPGAGAAAGGASEGSAGSGSGSAPAEPSGTESSGSSPSGGAAEGSGASGSEAAGSGSSTDESSGGLVGTVVHEVGNLLEHVLH